MKTLYRKSPLSFALVWIALYCACQTLAYPLSRRIGVTYSAHALFSLPLTAALLGWIWKNGLLARYGLCRPALPARRFLWYLPLLVLASCSLWNGAAVSLPPADTACYMVQMLCAGFLEEVIFRGLLFLALTAEGVKKAAIISSVTFGLGHLLHQVDGSGMELLANLCQVAWAIGLGFLFVLIFHRGGSLLPCILTHAAINCVGAFASEAVLTAEARILWSASRLAIVAAYALVLLKTLPPRELSPVPGPDE